jgi:hypothetical protein
MLVPMPVAWLDASAFDDLDPARFRWVAVGPARGLLMHAGRGVVPLLAALPVPRRAGVAVVLVDPSRIARAQVAFPDGLDHSLTRLGLALEWAGRGTPVEQRRWVGTLLEGFRRHVAEPTTALERTRRATRRLPDPPAPFRLAPRAFVRHLVRQVPHLAPAPPGMLGPPA